MRKLTHSLLVLLILISSSFPIFASNLSANKKRKISEKYIENELIIKYKEGLFSLDIKSQKGRLSQMGIETKSELSRKSLNLVEIPEEESVEEIIAILSKDPNIEYVQPNYIYKLQTINTNDTYKDLLWGLDNSGQDVDGVVGTADADIDAPEAWARYPGDEVIVAVIDSGVDYTHVDLVDSMWDGTDCVDIEGNYMGGCIHGYDFANNDKDPISSTSDHGTHIAGIIAGMKDNTKGVLGVNSSAKIMAIKVGLGDAYFGYDFSDYLSTFSIVGGLYFAQENGAKIINASWGGGGDISEYDELLYDTIANYDGLFIAAAGNDGENLDGESFFPCEFNLDNILCVASTDSDDNLSTFSNYGSLGVDLAAPGEHIASTIALDETNLIDEDFESVLSGQIPAGWNHAGNMEVDFVIAGLLGGIYGTKYIKGDSNYPYLGLSNNYIATPISDLSDATSARISFDTYCDTEYNADTWEDYLRLDLSSDGSIFEEYFTWDEYSLDDNNNEFDHSGITFGAFEFDLPEEYLTSNFGIRFTWIADSDSSKGTWGEGCIVDNLVVDRYDRLSSLYGYKDGTSMATPYVVGAASYIWSYNPNFSIDQVKSILMSSGDSLLSLQGKTVSGKRLNLNDALDLAQNTLSPWVKNGGTLGPISMAEFDSKIFQTVRGTDNGIYIRNSEDGFNWSSWKKNGGTRDAITMLEFDNKLYQAVRGTDNGIYTRSSSDGNSWSSWVKNGGSNGQITMIEYDNRLIQAVRGTDNGIYTRSSSDGSNWSSWKKNGGTVDTVTMTVFGGILYQAVRGTDNGIYTRSSSDGSNWSSWKKNGGTMDQITMIQFGSNLYQAVRGTDNGIYTRLSSDGNSWSSWKKNGGTIDTVDMVVYNSKLYQTVRGTDNGAYIRYSSDGTSWSSWSRDSFTYSQITSLIFNSQLIQSRRGTDNGIYVRLLRSL